MAEEIVGVTPEKALELTRKGYDWKKYVQSRLDCCVPIAADKGERNCVIEFDCKNGISLAECTANVTSVLKELGWGTGDVTNSPSSKFAIRINVWW